MILIVTGGRDAKADESVLYEYATRHGVTVFVQGGHWDGVDWDVAEWCRRQELPCLRVPAKWRTGTRGRGEGPIRNADMIHLAQALAAGLGEEVRGLAFPGGSGTSDCYEQMERAKIPIDDRRNST